jgi:hypothetical protein
MDHRDLAETALTQKRPTTAGVHATLALVDAVNDGLAHVTATVPGRLGVVVGDEATESEDETRHLELESFRHWAQETMETMDPQDPLVGHLATALFVMNDRAALRGKLESVQDNAQRLFEGISELHTTNNWELSDATQSLEALAEDILGKVGHP